ncbi:MAG: TDE2508 family outer membrane beta-barrel protein [Treponemataceae bacterium]
MKKFLSVLLILAIALTSVFAIEWEFGSESAVSKATKGTFATEVDDYMALTAYHELDFQKYLAFTTLSTQGINAGFAYKGKLYFSTYYNGNLWTTSATGPNVQAYQTENELNVLLGFEKFGIELFSKFNPKTQTTDTSVAKTETDDSEFALGAGVGGMTFEIKDFALKPYFVAGYLASVHKTVVTTKSDGKKTVSEIYGGSASSGKLHIELGADLDLPGKGLYSQGLGFAYTQGLAVYSPKNKDSAGKVVLEVRDGHAASEKIGFTYWGSFAFSDIFTLNFKTEPEFSFSSSSTGITIMNGYPVPVAPTLTKGFGMEIPVLVGFNCAVKPEKCNIFGGLEVKPFNLSWEKVNQNDPTVKLNNDGSGNSTVVATVGLGGEWLFSPQFSVAASLEIPVKPKFHTNIWDGELEIAFKLVK